LGGASDTKSHRISVKQTKSAKTNENTKFIFPPQTITQALLDVPKAMDNIRRYLNASENPPL
jgi:hypothetical protein